MSNKISEICLFVTVIVLTMVLVYGMLKIYKAAAQEPAYVDDLSKQWPPLGEPLEARFLLHSNQHHTFRLDTFTGQVWVLEGINTKEETFRKVEE